MEWNRALYDVMHLFVYFCSFLNFFPSSRLTASRLGPSTPQEEPASPTTRELLAVKAVAAVNPQPIPTTQRWKVWRPDGWRGGRVACCAQWSGAAPLCGRAYRGSPAPPCHPAPLATNQSGGRAERASRRYWGWVRAGCRDSRSVATAQNFCCRDVVEFIYFVGSFHEAELLLKL